MKLHPILVNSVLKRIGGLLTVLSLIAFTPESWAASSVRPPAPQPEAVLRLGTYLKPAPLDPFNTIDTVSSHLLPLIFNSLFHYDSNGELKPDLTRKLEISDDGLIYTFYLKENIKFHDGTSLTAEDAAHTFLLMSDKQISPPFSRNLEMVKEWKVISENVFQIILKEPTAHFLLNLWRIYIVPKHSFASSDPAKDLAAFVRRPVGTGPFQFENQDAVSGEMKLRANPGYFEGRPSLEEVNVRVFSDKGRIWSAFLRDEIDLVLYVEPSDYREIKNNPDFHTYRALSLGIYGLVFNLNDPVFNDRQLRQTIASAVNRKEVIEKTAAGDGFLVSGPFHPESYANDPTLPQQEYAPEKAKKILEEKGFSEKKPLHLGLLVNSKDPHMMMMAKIIRQQLQEIGIRVRFDFASGYAELAKKTYEDPSGFQSHLLVMNTGPDPDVVRQYWHSNTQINISRYSNPKVDALFDSAIKYPDRQKRQEAYRQIHAQLAEDQPAFFLYTPYVFHAVSSRFKEADFLSSPFFQVYMLKDLSLEEQLLTTKGGDAHDGNY